MPYAREGESKLSVVVPTLSVKHQTARAPSGDTRSLRLFSRVFTSARFFCFAFGGKDFVVGLASRLNLVGFRTFRFERMD